MKSFEAFGLDTTNHLPWRDGDRVPMAPKGFDVLAYLVEHAGQWLRMNFSRRCGQKRRSIPRFSENTF
jgi:DNA-binding response OmpR family regulator